MDIRKAKTGNKTVGTKVSDIPTQEKKQPPAPVIDEKTGEASTPLPDSIEDEIINEYLRYLKNNDISEEDIRAILSAIISTGNVTWSFELFDKIPVEFQIRKTWINDYILELLDKETSGDEKVSMVRYNNIIAVCNLAASLVKYDKETYKINTREDFDKARERVGNFTYIIQNALVNKLAVFDRAIAAATSNWGIKNFMKPQKDK